MDPVFKVPASPGTPLFPISPERANRQAIPQSPSLPNGISSRAVNESFGSPGRLSDVQGKVAQFNNLSRETTRKRTDSEAALRRAVLGREEAEGELWRLKNTNSDLIRQIEEYGERERKVGLRLEAKMVNPIHTILPPGSNKSRGACPEARGRKDKGKRRQSEIKRDTIPLKAGV